MKTQLILLSVSALFISALSAADAPLATETGHAILMRAPSMTKEQVDQEILFLVARRLMDAKYPSERGMILEQIEALTVVNGWHLSSSRTTRREYYALPDISTADAKYELALTLGAAGTANENVVLAGTITVTTKLGRFVLDASLFDREP